MVLVLKEQNVGKMLVRSKVSYIVYYVEGIVHSCVNSGLLLLIHVTIHVLPYGVVFVFTNQIDSVIQFVPYILGTNTEYVLFKTLLRRRNVSHG